MKIEPTDSIDRIKDILASSRLPVDDIGLSSGTSFFGVFDKGALVAVVGLEPYGNVGLLRSLAVSPAYQRAGLGKQLVRYAEEVAKEHGVEFLYLLTTTAEAYFQRLGYQAALRSEAPEPIRATPQFSGLCPASSAFLAKLLKTD